MSQSYFAELETDRVIRDTYFRDFDYKGTMMEVGGATPEFLSMSRHFKLNGWRTIIIEPIPEFVKQHREFGNEVYEFAAGPSNSNNVPFQKVNWVNDPANPITFHSLSSFVIKNEYLKMEGYENGVKDLIDHQYSVNKRTGRKPEITEIKVNVRTLNVIYEFLGLKTLDILSIDVEGYELEVLEGFSIQFYKPKVIVLENANGDPNYIDYMEERGYKLDKYVKYNEIYIPM
jgi:FkbM family methyltransferase